MNFSAILAMILQYGPQSVTVIENLIAKIEGGGTPTVADVEKEFAGLKTYGAYGVALATPTATSTSSTATASSATTT